MNNKLMLLIALMCFSLLGSNAYAILWNITDMSVTNATEYFNLQPFAVTINWYNVSYTGEANTFVSQYQFDGGSWTTLTNSYLANTSANSSAYSDFTSKGKDSIRNITARINDTLGSGNLSTLTRWFYIDEELANGVSITVDHVANNTEYFNTSIDYFVRLNDTLSSCIAYIGSSTTGSVAMSNVASNRNFTNSSALTFTSNNYAWRYLNVRCSDAFGNYSWSNSTTNSLAYRIDEQSPNSLSFTKYNLANDTEYYAFTPQFNFTVNATISNCYALTGSSVDTSMTLNTWQSNTNWTNSSAIHASNGDAWRYVAFKCVDAFGNTSWSNSSSGTGGAVRWKLNEFAANSLTFTLLNMTNGTAYTSLKTNPFNFNITHTATTCYGAWNYTQSLAFANTSGNRQYWTNNSVLSTSPAETGYGIWHTYDFNCSDLYGNSSSSSVYYIKIDATNPVINDVSISLGNNSALNSNNLTIRFNVTDKSPYLNYIYTVFPNGTAVNFTTTDSVTSTNSTTSVTLTGSNLPIDGVYYFNLTAIDLAGNVGRGLNYSYTVTKTKSGEWMPISIYKNVTLAQIAAEMPNVTYVQIYDNFYKNFTIYQVGLSTNANVIVNETLNATMIKTTGDISYIRAPAITFDSVAINMWTGGWNFYAPVSKKSLNATMYASTACGNASATITNETFNTTSSISVLYPSIITVTSIANTTYTVPAANYTYTATTVNFTDASKGIVRSNIYNITYTWTPAYSYSNCANVTYISWYNQTSGMNCVARRGFTATSCSGLTSTGITPELGEPLWMLTKTNISFSRSSV